MTEFVGLKLRTLREDSGMTIEELSENSNISIEQLKEIENNEITPSINVTKRICEAMGVRIGTLLDGSEAVPISVVRSDEAHECSSFSTNSTVHSKNLSYKSLTTKANRVIDPYLIEVSNESVDGDSLQSHEGEEFIYVLEGAVEFFYGDKHIELKTGDSLYFDSLIPHCMRASGDGAKVLSTHYRI